MKETSLAIALSGLGFILAVIWGSPLIRIFKHYRLGKMIRVEGPDSHITKMGTPTMGGLMILIPVAAVTILLNAVDLLGTNILGRSVLLPLVVMFAYGLLGAIDDWEGIRGPRKGLGMRARTKFFIQVILAIITAYILKNILLVPQMYWPGLHVEIDLGIWYIPMAAFVIVLMSNAINLTDGLDGLAGLICCHSLCSLREHRLDAGQFICRTFLLHHRRRILRFPLVQCSPCHAFHG